MSSVFLYIGIVAIWAFVLVPRWLRRHAHQEAELAGSDQSDDASYDEDPGHRQDADYAEDADPPPSFARATPSQSRARMLQARRRLLTLLVLITVIAAGSSYVRFTPWWVCVPPAFILGLYLMLLRAVAVADADHARAAGRTRRTTLPEPVAQPSAQIIDISGRLDDQLYDQYTDASVRAVGD